MPAAARAVPSCSCSSVGLVGAAVYAVPRNDRILQASVLQVSSRRPPGVVRAPMVARCPSLGAASRLPHTRHQRGQGEGRGCQAGTLPE